MANVIVINHLSLDGVVQGPGRPDEDVRDGFALGGWGAERTDDEVMAPIGRVAGNAGPMLFGRWTYESLFAHWPKQTDGNPFTASLDAAHKYVASTTLSEPLPWQNSTLLKGDIVAAVRELKVQEDKDILVFGSGVLLQTLIAAGLVDTFLLLIHPVVLGHGRRLFPDGGVPFSLRVVDATATSSGILALTYEGDRG